jgi:hypothetical protein
MPGCLAISVAGNISSAALQNSLLTLDAHSKSHNLICVWNRHFQPTTQQGGNLDACMHTKLWDFQTFAGKKLMHCLKYQACVLPNGTTQLFFWT